jgi:autotransporter strand-loop-strand O-heptosyltransferase
MNHFKVSYVTTLPKEGNAPRVTIFGDELKKYKVCFYELNRGLVTSGFCETNQTIIGKTKQWFTEWIIIIEDENGVPAFHEYFNPKGKKVFIKMDSYALGDNIAWMPYVEEFRKKHECTVICSTFYNNLFIDSYPEIIFAKPNTQIDNVYVQYYIGASDDDNPYYSPVKFSKVPLQIVATDILGLDGHEIRPDLSILCKHLHPKIDGNYVTLSEYGSSDIKKWKAEDGWQKVVDYLTSTGIKVLVISKEPTNLKNVIDATGDVPLENRVLDIYHAKAHLGVSSGLSWLAWAVGTHVVMISDFTPKWHEFQTNISRFCASDLDSINYSVDTQTKIEDVIQKFGELGL